MKVAAQATPGEVGIDVANWNWKVVRQFIKGAARRGQRRAGRGAGEGSTDAGEGVEDEGQQATRKASRAARSPASADRRAVCAAATARTSSPTGADREDAPGSKRPPVDREAPHRYTDCSHTGERGWGAPSG